MLIRWLALLSLPAALSAAVPPTQTAPATPERHFGMEQMTVGFRMLSVPDPVQGKTIPLLVFYPARGTSATLHFGPFEIAAAGDAPVSGERLPIVIVSHGSGGTPWTMRDLALDLAGAGFVAVLPEHLGDSLSDSSLFGTADNLRNRPRHIKLATDALLSDRQLGPHVRGDRTAAVGLSMGGYSILAAAGGKPWTGPQESKGAPFAPVEVTEDERIKVLVLLAPATAWFRPAGSLSAVRVPVMMRTGTRDVVTPAFHSDIVRRDIAPALLDYLAVPNAGHFSFMSSFPASMKKADFPPSQDPPGFDRDAYRPTLHQDIIRFLRKALAVS